MNVQDLIDKANREEREALARTRGETLDWLSEPETVQQESESEVSEEQGDDSVQISDIPDDVDMDVPQLGEGGEIQLVHEELPDLETPPVDVVNYDDFDEDVTQVVHDIEEEDYEQSLDDQEPDENPGLTRVITVDGPANPDDVSVTAQDDKVANEQFESQMAMAEQITDQLSRDLQPQFEALKAVLPQQVHTYFDEQMLLATYLRDRG